MKRIYLAGPDVFRADALEHFKLMKKLCSKYGFEGLSPFDNEKNFVGDSFTKEHSIYIFNCNHELIKICDIIVANLVPFRGACIDDGTSWELGCGYCNGKLLYGYTPYDKMLLKTITYMNFEMQLQSVYPNIESFDNNCVNLMIQESIELSGGKILDSFEKCLIDLCDKFDGSNYS
jgi:nucleoside 2-deoxyribosyltransferase